jgi:hypothetical protein
MRPLLIHLVNPKTYSLTTRPLYLNRALYSPLAGLLAVAGALPRDRCKVVLTDENIEPRASRCAGAESAPAVPLHSVHEERGSDGS